MARTRAEIEAEYRKAIGDDFEAAVKALDALAASYEACADDLSVNGTLGDNPKYQPAYRTFQRVGRSMAVLAMQNDAAMERAQKILREEEDADEPNGGRLLREGGLRLKEVA